MSFWSAWWRRRAAGAPDTARSAYGRADGDDRSGKAGRQAAATPEAVQDAATPQGGIAVALRGWQRMRELGGAVTLYHVAQQPRKVFEASGVGRMVTIV